MEREPRNERFSSRPIRLVGLPLWLRLLIVAIFGLLAIASRSWAYTSLWAVLAALSLGVTVWLERSSR